MVIADQTTWHNWPVVVVPVLKESTNVQNNHTCSWNPNSPKRTTVISETSLGVKLYAVRSKILKGVAGIQVGVGIPNSNVPDFITIIFHMDNPPVIVIDPEREAAGLLIAKPVSPYIVVLILCRRVVDPPYWLFGLRSTKVTRHDKSENACQGSSCHHF
jgi:hypothetical protein